MEDTTVIVFTPNNCRILKNPENLNIYQHMSNAHINPDLSAVKKIPPHFWKVIEGKIVPMTLVEMSQRENHHTDTGVDNSLRKLSKRQLRPPMNKKNLIIWSLVGLVILLTECLFKSHI